MDKKVQKSLVIKEDALAELEEQVVYFCLNYSVSYPNTKNMSLKCRATGYSLKQSPLCIWLLYPISFLKGSHLIAAWQFGHLAI